MASLQEYENKYRNVRIYRDDGVLFVQLHTNDREFIIGPESVAELVDCWWEMGRDLENRVVIVTGTGSAFVTMAGALPGGGSTAEVHGDIGSSDRGDPGLRGNVDPVPVFERIASEGFPFMLGPLTCPVISAINGACLSHAQYGLLADIVLCSDDAAFADDTHFAAGAMPGDGEHVLWPALLGPRRGAYFLLAEQKLSAWDAYELGVVNEVLSKDELLPRAWELARGIAKKPLRTLRNTRKLLLREWQRLAFMHTGYGIANEFLFMNVDPHHFFPEWFYGPPVSYKWDGTRLARPRVSRPEGNSEGSGNG